MKQKPNIATLLVAAITMVAMFATSCNQSKTEAAQEQVDTLPMMVMQIKKCSKLYVAEYHVHKIITHEDNLSINGRFMKQDYNIDLPMGKRKIAIPMDATIKAYIDFANFDETNISRHGSKIEILLPDPHIVISSTRIDHKGVKEYVPLLRSRFSDDELTNYERQGRNAIVDDLPNMGITEMAQESAARTLIPMIKQLGFNENDIVITFRKNFGKTDYLQLIDKLSIENGKQKP